ncbi:translation initiation factor IF-2 N-terminal domain-containing protein [Pseudomonas alliivorans]|nr:translation initiation factor IF-2 N-terminal domain-containing protein [Pseudomonas alliivorans]MEE4779574.1 translation initiation factor IF-2 N-terminal domain-containing protein [Pseudomonas alliivorans]
MSDVTVFELAKVVGTPLDKLLEQFSSAGLNHSKGSDFVTDQDKMILLGYLKSSNKAASSGRERKISVVRGTPALRVAGSKTITVEVRKKKVFVAPSKVEFDGGDNISDIIGYSHDLDEGVSKAGRWSKLSAIEIKNFKAIKALRLPLADVTILVGPNGSGKSSVLQAIHWAARASSYIEPKKQSEVVSFDRLDYSPSSEPLKTAHKSELSSGKGSVPTFVSFIVEATEKEAGSIASVKINAARNKSGVSVSIDGGLAVTPFKQRKELITAYIPGLAGLSEKETVLVQPLLRRQAASGDAGGVLRNVLFNLANRQPGEEDLSFAAQRVQKLSQLVQMVHPGVEIETAFDDREDFHINAMFVDERLGSVKRPLESAATGILQVVQIFAYLVLFRPKLLLIDEPDAHLHPDKQERLIEALERAAGDFNIQVILSTHSPNIARAASHRSKLVWVRDGEAVDEEDDIIMALLGWGGLDKKILFFVEDEDASPIISILRQWPSLYRQVAVCRCFGIDNLPKNSLLRGFIGDNNFGVKVLIHRDRDFMTSDDADLWKSRYNTEGVGVWVTDHVDAEAYFCQPEYLASLFSVDEEQAQKWVNAAVQASGAGARSTFLEKRRVMIRFLYENGGGQNSEELWEQLGEVGPKTIVGKKLHKALKVEVKKSGCDDRLLDKFVIPKNFEMAVSLKTNLENLLK